jgi:2',3'-cyclic-nucleotide 2'-phosphodiesterase / 3'-nucleotidase
MAILSAAMSLAALAGCGDDTSPSQPDAGTDKDASPDTSTPKGSVATFAVLESTDIHTNILSYDYFKLVEDKSIGLERTSTLVNQAREEFPNNVLVDNGDTIQGTVLADYQALIKPVSCDETLAMYKVMNQMKFDVGGIGNHEFNYGLPFLAQVTHTPFDVEGIDTSGMASCKGPAFPQVNANVFSTKTQRNLFQPSAIVTKTITATTPDGATIEGTLKVGFLAFTPPQIVTWDKRWLDGKVTTKGVMEVAAPIVEDLHSKGADLVIAIIHGGLNNSPYTETLENQAWYLAQVPGIDAMLMGHSHQIFPNASSTGAQFNLPMVDKDKGFVAGVPSLMANFWGQHLGVIKLGLTFDGEHWSIDTTKTIVEARPITTTCTNGLPVACDATGKWRTGASCSFATACAGQPDKTKVYVNVDPAIGQLIDAEHQGTIAYVKTPIGTSDFEMSTFFADVGDVSAIQIVNQAQADYIKEYIGPTPDPNNPLVQKCPDCPILSVSAPFKSGFQGGNDYTDVPAGSIAINNAADLYLFANTIYAVKATGAQILDWLETAATRFAQIDPLSTKEQPLINLAMPGYNFDMFTDPDITYEIDVTQPLPPMGMKASGRIKNLSYKGQPMPMEKNFIVVTNNYRASGGGSFPGLDGSTTIYTAPDTNREALIQYIKKYMKLTRVDNGSARSWRFAKLPAKTSGPVTFKSAQNALTKAQEAGLTNISLFNADDGSGKMLSVYEIDLSQ